MKKQTLHLAVFTLLVGARVPPVCAQWIGSDAEAGVQNIGKSIGDIQQKYETRKQAANRAEDQRDRNRFYKGVIAAMEKEARSKIRGSLSTGNEATRDFSHYYAEMSNGKVCCYTYSNNKEEGIALSCK